MKIEKIEKLIANFSQPLANFIHIRNLKKINHRLILKRVLIVTKFNQKAW